ncbi:glycosyl hydrolase family 18 protein [Dethiosulfatibacter aminovorans]|uniref:glycosyl hydrolase family 18 protein n=1 Tax=Dethiosulfatibacter aminovorans TaxID=332095 RepID=UPI0015879BC7|nr:glycosyl hydrolase family 18 protein [Dethiosulfatibacter aminovorans]
MNGNLIGDSSSLIQESGNTFIEVEMLKENDLLDLFCSEDENLILIYYDLKAYTVDLTRNENAVWRSVDSKIFLNFSYIEDKMNGQYRMSLYEELLFIEDDYSEITNERNIIFYGEPGIGSEKISNVEKGSELTRYEITEDWSFVRLGDKLGYVRNDYLKSVKSYSGIILLENKSTKNIVLAWDFFTREPSGFEEEEIYPGMNVVCPTWHHLEEDTREFSNWYMKEYIDYYNENKIEVWGTFSNSFDPDLTSDVLKDRYARSDIVGKIVDMAVGNDYRGVNIDFENIYLKDREKLAAFFRELYMRLKKENILMSVDVSVISSSENWSLFYDRKTIGRYSDYVVLMAYDERTLPNHGIGSIASLPWVEKGISGLLDYVQGEKIILGLPFYTRLWETIETEKGAVYDVTTLRLTSADVFVKDNDFEFEYDEESGQNYGEKTVDNVYYQIWVEDEVSLRKRLELVEKYNLNGVGVWSLNYSKNSMWKLIANFFENL